MRHSEGDRVYCPAMGQYGTVLKREASPGLLCIVKYLVQFDCGGESVLCAPWELVAAKPTVRPALRLVAVNGEVIA
jgi:hypothetical protein